MVPLRRDALQGEAKWLALARTQRRGAEVDGIRIRASSLKDVQGQQFIADDLSHVILENNANHSMCNGLVTSACHASVQIGIRRPHKTLPRAHLNVGDLAV